MPLTPDNDPFLDEFTRLDLRPDTEYFKEDTGAPEAVLQEELEAEQPAAPPAPPAPAPELEPEPEAEHTTFDDGSSMDMKKTGKGWEITLDTNTGRSPERFVGRTKDEVIRKMAFAKVNATRQIHKLNKEIKFAVTEPAQPQPKQEPQRTPRRELTADEKFEISTQLATDPDLAFENWFQKKTGLTSNQLADLSRRGAQAHQELITESVARGFVSTYPDYVTKYQSDENYLAIIKYMAKQHLNKRVRDSDDGSDAIVELQSKGFWTVRSLGDAFETLAEDGLLTPVRKPKPAETAPAPVAPPPPPAPVPAAQEPTPRQGIPRGSRAGLGIRATEATALAVPNDERPPSVEDFHALSDEELKKLMAASMQHYRNSRGRR